jgi:DNA-binding GntR family transcriptional regulator
MSDVAAAAPRYEQTRQSVVDLIASGRYEPGARLPSESALAQMFGVHRLTARRALEELVREGVVVARKGSGTYVAPVRQHLPISVPLTRDGFAPSLRRQLEAAGRDFREELFDVARDSKAPLVPEELRERGPLSRVRSALWVDGAHWVYSMSWFTHDRVTGIKRSWRHTDGLYGVILDQVGELRSRWRSFQAEPASSEVAEILDIRPGAPVLVREGLTADKDGIPLLYVRRLARADLVRYVIDYETPAP